jgi:hypothetical protein
MVSVEVMISEKDYLISDKGVVVSGGRRQGSHGTPPPLSDIKKKIKKIKNKARGARQRAHEALRTAK